MITAIVPTFRRPASLGRCLEALARARPPRSDLEVLVVDDGSGSAPVELVAGCAGRLPVRLLEVPHAGPAAARNAGAAQARGGLLAFTDDDCEVGAGWLRLLEDEAARCPGAMIGGRTVNALGDNRYSEASQRLVTLFQLAHGSDGPAPGFFATNNLLVPTAPFRALGGFDEAFPLAAGEDRDFCERWRAAGHPTRYAPRAEVRHHHALTWRTFLAQQFRYGRGAWTLRVRRHQRAAARVSTSEVRRMVLHAARGDAGAPRASLVPLLVASQLAVAAGLAWERARWRPPLDRVPARGA